MIQIHSQTNRKFALFDIRSLTVPATTFLDAGGGASTRIENSASEGRETQHTDVDESDER